LEINANDNISIAHNPTKEQTRANKIPSNISSLSNWNEFWGSLTTRAREVVVNRKGKQFVCKNFRFSLNSVEFAVVVGRKNFSHSHALGL
jgi:hypothetical protein